MGAFEPIVLEPVQSREQRLLFRELVGRHHYLGHAVPFGAHLRYLVYSRRAGAGRVQFSSPAWRMAAREGWIGWDEPARRANLQRVVNHSRFLILPWVHIANLASVVLVARAARGCRRTGRRATGSSRCWWRRWSTRAATAGHCYRAANWIRLGETTGRGRMDREHRREGAAPKVVWVYPLVANAAQRLRGQRVRAARACGRGGRVRDGTRRVCPDH